ncbi:MAG: anaerobic ribonucleoside-triphosphate reductase activating protein [Acholeplasmatales bacterium]|jgi:anaerobic ribonucleoside-triphosphate reductase activating protein|nr:anaerobic ribonucleoside-triphosphate reductase activating protein [Acholeplasmatales bacterium]MBQ6783234.1 anaerobic ribonucleoside-triphosphate reductase activating protein [Acholeplasmatales bacterium]MBR6288858.1 anaerobic ribonucleoside-triphosphate reductase activating protein [Acholeplasmatales bacterium]
MRYHNITKDDMLNGSGLRVVLWVAGCQHHCPYCQNPITHDPNGGIPFDEAAKQEIFAELEKPYVSGITFSGGDPLYPGHVNEIGELIAEINARFPHKTKWLYTGYTYEQISGLPFIGMLDVICDGRFEIDKFDPKLHWVGSSNQRVIDVKKTKREGKVILFEDGSAD